MANFYHQNTFIYNSGYNNYWEPQLPSSTHIHQDSVAAQLGLTPMEMAPILQEQREFLRNELRNKLAQPPLVLTRPATSSYCHREPWVMPNTYINPESPAGQLGLTPEELMPILHDQQEFLRDKLAQPPPALTRPTTTYHLKAQTEPHPNPNSLSPQQEATRLGITPEELAVIGEDSIHKQIEWIAKDKAKWREHEEKRWQGKAGEDSESEEKENRKRTEETERQERDETTQERTTTTTHPRPAPPPFVHPDSAAQLGLTLEEATEVHEERIRAQEEIQGEIEEEDRLWRQRRELGEHGTPPPPPKYLTHNMADDHKEPGNTVSVTLRDDTIGQLTREPGAQPELTEIVQRI
jgi:hypothetical protein